MAKIEDDSSRNSPLSEYGIMKAVLQGLPNIKQLNTAAQVCKNWNDIARIIKKNRHQIYQASNSESFCDCGCVEELLKVIKSQPCLCLIFLTHEGMGEIPPPLPELHLGVEHSKDHNGRCTEYKLIHFLRENLPTDCLVVGGVSSGVVMSDPQFVTTEIEEGNAYSLLLIPQIPGLTMRSFFLDKKKIKKLNWAITSQQESDINQMLNMEQIDQTQCLILIGTDPYRESKCIENLYKYFQEKKNPFIAIAGGFVEAVIHPDVIDGEREIGLMGLAFSGTELRASSVVIPPEVTTEADIEKIILKMKDKHLSSEQLAAKRWKSIGFMFACVARGTHVHGRAGVESTLFRKHFPATHLIGFFGNGEIGFNSSPPPATTGASAAPDENLAQTHKKSRATYLHSYSTAFTVISFPV